MVGLGAVFLLLAVAEVRCYCCCLIQRDFHGVILVCSVVTCAECGDSAAAEPLLAPEHGPHRSSLEALVKTRCL